MSRAMATTVKFFSNSEGFYCGVGFYDHARSEDNPDVDTGSRLCAVMSALSSYVEVLAETAAVDYGLSVTKTPPSRVITWEAYYAMQTPVAALRHTVRTLAAQYPEFVKIEEEAVDGDY